MEGEILGIDPTGTTDSVAAFTNIAYNIGGVIGPLASGLMVQNLGSSESCTLIGDIQITLGIFSYTVVSVIYRYRKAESLLRTKGHKISKSCSLRCPIWRPIVNCPIKKE